MQTIDTTMLGGQQYPLLHHFADWTITTYKLADEADREAVVGPARKGLAWVKDDAMNVLQADNLTAKEIMDALGIQVSYRKGAAVASKRLSRLFRPYRYGVELPQDELYIIEDRTLDPQVWDGMFRISRACVQKCTQYLDNLNEDRQRRFERELKGVRRVELTVITSDGQLKGHALVVDELPYGADIQAPVGAWKKELKITNGMAFLGVAPVHGDDVMRLDIQSLINHLPFFGVDRLLTWLDQMNTHMFSLIESGDSLGIINILYSLNSVEKLETLEQWPVGTYLVSGGNPRWFGGVMRGIARTYASKLMSQADRMRWPIPGGRYYIAPAEVGSVEVRRGHCLIDHEAGTVYVNELDWAEYIVSRLGGADGDDALWVVPFSNALEKQVLLWRSPNQWGEYVVLKPEPGSHTIAWIDGTSYPELDMSKLATPIEAQGNSYGTIRPIQDDKAKAENYNLESLSVATRQVIKNLGVLGRFCNTLMLHVAINGGIPKMLPATLEDVIDYSVKDVGDMSHVIEWINLEQAQLARQSVPKVMAHRLGKLSDHVRLSTDHVIDKLHDAMSQAVKTFTARVDELSKTCMPPEIIFELGNEQLTSGIAIRSAYGNFLRKSERNRESLDQAHALVQKMLDQENDPIAVTYGVTAAVYTMGAGKERLHDGVLWHGIGPRMNAALRQLGLIAYLDWDGRRVQLIYAVQPEDLSVPVQAHIKAVWWNIRYAHTGSNAEMGQIPARERDSYKRIAAQLGVNAPGLRFEVAPLDGRYEVRGPSGYTIGLVDKHQGIAPGKYEVLSCIPWDGNFSVALGRRV
jgi:hypothetical protein